MITINKVNKGINVGKCEIPIRQSRYFRRFQAMMFLTIFDDISGLL